MITRSLSSLALCVSLLGGAIACGPDVGSQTENQHDSFFHPTEHGELVFGADNEASFTEDSRFHAWTFTLTGPASVELSTKLHTANLDSVMYLYQMGEDGRWGSYIAKNDDHDGTPISFIAKDLEAGDYRIKIKAVKSFQRGDFAVLGGCSGEGCPVDEGVCQSSGPSSLPEASGYTTGCDPIFHAIATTPVGTAPSACASKLEERAVAYYKDYWDGIFGYDELAGEEGVEPYVDLEHHPGAGSVVNVGLGGDEDAMDFVFDAEGQLVFYHQHNQSPDWAWLCPAGETAAEPPEGCATDILGNAGYSVEDVSAAEGTTLAGAGDDLPPQVTAAIDAYGVDDGTEIAFSYTLWSTSYQDGADVKLSSEPGGEVSFVLVGDPEWGMTLAFRSDESGTAMACETL